MKPYTQDFGILDVAQGILRLSRRTPMNDLDSKHRHLMHGADRSLALSRPLRASAPSCISDSKGPIVLTGEYQYNPLKRS